MRKPLLVLTLASVATLWACGADSDTPREYRVVADPAPAEPIDGSGLIAFRSRRDDPPSKSDIIVMDADGGAQLNLSNHPASDSDPAW